MPSVRAVLRHGTNQQPQTILAFRLLLAGGHGRWELSLYGRWYAELNAEVIVHTQSDTQIPNTHLSGEVDVGALPELEENSDRS